MASQGYATTGSPMYRKPRYVDQINAQRAAIPGMLQRRYQAKRDKAEDTFREQELANQATSNQISRENIAQTAALKKMDMEFNKEAAKRGAGLEAMKLGVTMAQNTPKFGSTAVMPRGIEAGTGLKAKGGGGFMNTVQRGANLLAPAAVSGITGYGAGAAFGGKSKAKKALWGAGAGLLSNFLQGNSVSNWGSTGANVGAGLIGGLFS